MLVLSRQRGETVMIGDAIEVTIIDVRGDKVRLGITAPRDVTVHRKEVYDSIRRQVTGPNNHHPGEGGKGASPESPGGEGPGGNAPGAEKA